MASQTGKTCVLSIRVDHTDLATVAKILKVHYQFETDSLGSLASHCVHFLAHILTTKYKGRIDLLEEALTYLRENGLKDQQVTRRRGRAMLNKLNNETFEMPPEVEGGMDEELKNI